MKRTHFLLLALMMFFAMSSARGLAQSQCSWMNAATAGGFLGGEVQTTVTGFTSDGDATCQFTRGDSILRIAVHTMPHIAQDFSAYVAQCGAGAIALKGVGNEAVQCMSKDEEVIIGRVRERAFIITIKADWIRRPPTSPTKTRNPVSDDSENIAEQVAGSMF